MQNAEERRLVRQWVKGGGLVIERGVCSEESKQGRTVSIILVRVGEQVT